MFNTARNSHQIDGPTNPLEEEKQVNKELTYSPGKALSQNEASADVSDS